jgi:hypothetical protein
VAQEKCQVAEGSNGAVLALTAKGQSTSVVPKSFSSSGLSKCATVSDNCPIPTSHFFHNFSRTAIHFTRASPHRNKLRSEMCADRSSGNGVMHTLTLLPSGGFSACAGCKYGLRLFTIRKVSSRTVLSLGSVVLLWRTSDCDNDRASS